MTVNTAYHSSRRSRKRTEKTHKFLTKNKKNSLSFVLQVSLSHFINSFCQLSFFAPLNHSKSVSPFFVYRLEGLSQLGQQSQSYGQTNYFIFFLWNFIYFPLCLVKIQFIWLIIEISEVFMRSFFFLVYLWKYN